MTIEIKAVSGKVLYTATTASDVKAALVEAVKSRTYLRGANLYGANLGGAKNAELAIAKTRIIPDEGPIVGWKKTTSGRIVKLRIPSKAKRSHASGRKCRASEAKVLAIFNADGTEATEAWSIHDHRFTYTVGATVKPTEPFDENPWNECASGIHFYITRLEAENHA